MARLRGALITLFVAAACGKENASEPVPDRPAEQWTTVQALDYRLSLPPAWATDRRELPGNGVSYLGLSDDDFRPNVILYQKPWERSATEWQDWRREKYDHPKSGAQILEKMKTTVAGMSALRMVYELEDLDRDRGEVRTFVLIDWYFGHGGILRGVATKKTFAPTYRRVFERMAATLQHRPP
ncbi:MAG: hypothetical protein ACYTAF_17325 [Planctomycetota bacterium]|jgi:hypothetical protein